MSNNRRAPSLETSIPRSGSGRKGAPSISSDDPINDLPPELLLNIIQELLHPSSTHRYYDCLYSLMLVCSGWASLIKDTPTLWAIADEGHPERLPLVLERSNPAPLTIENYKMGTHPGLDDALFKESHRWESIQIEQSPSDTDGDLKRRLESTTAPTLKNFHVVGSIHASPDPVLNLFRGEAPKLESIHLTRFNALLDRVSFDGLRSMELTDTTCTAMTRSSFFRMVQRCHHLTALHVKNVKLDRWPSAGDQETIFELPNLESFHISNIHGLDTIGMISSVRLPHCTNIEILNFDAETIEDVPTLQSTPYLVAAFQSVLRLADRVTLAVEDAIFRITTFSAGRKIFDFCGELEGEPLKVLEIVATQWGLAELNVRTEIRLNFESYDPEPLLTVLRTLPNVTTIVLFQLEEEFVQSVLQLLGDSYTTVDGVPTRYCPNLENFLTYQCSTSDDTPGDFITMLERRYGEGGKRPRRVKYMQMTIPENDATYHKKHVRPLWEALKPEGMLGWNPKVAEPRFGLDDEDVEASADAEDDPVLHAEFDAEFYWLSDSEEEE